MPDYSLELPAMYVEGNTDLHTILQLLARHGIGLDKELGPVILKSAQNDKGVLDAMSTAARASTNRSVGFVIDADESVAYRWQAARDRMKDLDLVLPDQISAEGFIGDSLKRKTRIGVWIMPDNVTDTGKLEDLIHTLVPIDDNLMGHAHAATEQASTLGAAFAPHDRLKAVLHAWLSWQREPGFSFGMALKAHFFRHDSNQALRFVNWFRKLFNLT